MAKLLQKKFIGNDQVDGDKLKLLAGQTIRKDDGAGGDIDVLAVIDADIAQVQSNLDAETVARNLATDALQTQANTIQADLGTEIQTRSDQIGQVYTDFNANDALLTTIINDEVARATAEEASIRSDFAAADLQVLGDAQDYTDQEYTALESALSAIIAQEVSDRTAGDASLQSQIDSLSGSSGSSLAAIEAALAQEVLDRIADVNAEETRALAAEAGLQTQINNVLSNVDNAALDSLTEIVSAFQAADASLNGAITALSTGLSADIDAEESARIAADAALQGEIDAEEIARAAADSTLQTNINSEAATRLAADNALDARVDVLESVTWKKQKFAMSNGQISISLAHLPVSGSVSMFVDQVPMHESIDAGVTDDFSISGTSVSFINDFSATGNKKMQNNDTVYVKYQYKA
jgi:hypothetical protein